MKIVRFNKPPSNLEWVGYVWRCPWGHWIADEIMCRECFGHGRHSCADMRAQGLSAPGERAVFVWHNVHLEASLPENHYLWEMLERGAKEEPEIEEFICLHKRNEEVQSPSDNLLVREVDWPLEDED